MKMKKTTLISLTFLIGVMIFSSTQHSNASADYGITSVQHTPDPLLMEQNMTVTVVFYDASELHSLRLLVCELAPQFICDPSPILMERVGDTFSASYILTQEENATIGYHIQINYMNESSIMIPDSQDFLSMSNIVEPLTGDFYFSAGEIEEVNTSNGFTIGLISSVILVAAIVIKRKRKNW